MFFSADTCAEEYANTIAIVCQENLEAFASSVFSCVSVTAFARVPSEGGGEGESKAAPPPGVSGGEGR